MVIGDGLVGDAVCFVVFAWQQAAEFFRPLGGWFDDGLFLNSTPCDGEHSELYWKSCLSCGFGLV